MADSLITPVQVIHSVPLIAGVDEVGRGALFGPVVAAAVVLSEAAQSQLRDLGVTDSKQLSAKRREQLLVDIKALASGYAIGMASVHEIDRLNILQATLLAMGRAIKRLEPQPSLCLIDGNQRLPHMSISQQCVVKGDQIHIEIAAASILAKVWRDTLIIRLDSRYPGYDLRYNKGYGSAKHREGLKRFGATCQHRKSFKGCQQMSLL
jgi:ribonuclease HII